MLREGVERLFEADGQFILAVSKERGCSVELFRDRNGILPLVYARRGQVIAVSMWNQDALDLVGLSASPSRTLLEHWPLFRLTFPPSTPLDEVHCLSSRNSLRIEADRILQQEHQLFPPPQKPFESLASASSGLGDHLSRSVEKRAKGLENLGIWLSGGNDSSLLVALTREFYADKIKSVFVTFENYGRDYRALASYVANRYETDHTEIEVSCREYLNHWAETIGAIEAPINHPGVIGQQVALRTLKGVRFMLDGQGADTVFGGPFWAPLLFLSWMGRVLPNTARRVILGCSRKIQENGLLSKSSAKALRALGTDLNEYFHSESSFTDEFSTDEVFGPGTYRKTLRSCQNITAEDPIRDMFFYHVLDWNVPDGITPEMRLGFRHSVIFLYPFLDYALLKESLRLPSWIRYYFRTKKASLKKYAERFFDHDFIYKPKEGFGVPLGKWCTRPEFAPFLGLPLEERSLRRGWWNERAVKEIMQLHRSGGGTDESAESLPWITVNLELWARICIEGDSPEQYRID
jgi:asparagine synthase (glutamine-hydrolysing)